MWSAPQQVDPAGGSGSPEVARGGIDDRRSLARSLSESVISLILAVMLFRTFAAEGYMISTGSMAPTLLGYHKQVACPTCGFAFPFGVAYDTDPTGEAEQLERRRSVAVCPNCGQEHIHLEKVPRNHGDQLLVCKPSYEYRPPLRWEICVFRNPANPQEAYVKRVVGLPGERVQILRGDVFIDGEIARKDYARQVSMRIPVHDHNSRALRDPLARERWFVVPHADEHDSVPQWLADGAAYRLQSGLAAGVDAETFSWVQYRHWVRARGRHASRVPLAAWPQDVDPPDPAGGGRLNWNAETGQLAYEGALSEALRDQLLAHTEDALFRQAVRALYDISHEAPITDQYGYNPPEENAGAVPLRDVMLSLRLDVEYGHGEFVVELTDGMQTFSYVLDFQHRECRMHRNGSNEPTQTGPLPAGVAGRPVIVEASLIDRQALLAIDGQVVLPPFEFEVPAQLSEAPRSAVRFGGRALDAVVDELMVYRDVYYTADRALHGVETPYRLPWDSYFMLGDNSPVSHDSRRWGDGAVPRSLLIGRPFMVHLPSRPAYLKIGPWETQLRLPDFSRMKLIR